MSKLKTECSDCALSSKVLIKSTVRIINNIEEGRVESVTSWLCEKCTGKSISLIKRDFLDKELEG